MSIDIFDWLAITSIPFILATFKHWLREKKDDE